MAKIEELTSTSAAVGTPVSVGLRETFQPIKALVGCYVGLALVGFGAAVVLRDHPELVSPAVWVRCGIVLVTSVALYRFAAMAAQGKRSALVRLRIASIAIPVAVAVIVALPDSFPVWVKVQQGLCAVVVAGVAVLVNRRSLLEHFTR